MKITTTIFALLNLTCASIINYTDINNFYLKYKYTPSSISDICGYYQDALVHIILKSDSTFEFRDACPSDIIISDDPISHIEGRYYLKQDSLFFIFSKIVYSKDTSSAQSIQFSVFSHGYHLSKLQYDYSPSTLLKSIEGVYILTPEKTRSIIGQKVDLDDLLKSKSFKRFGYFILHKY